MKRFRLGTVVVVSVALIGSACSDDTGLPDIASVTPEDVPVGAVVRVTEMGCQPPTATIEAGEWVAFDAAVDGVEVAPAPDGSAPDSGPMLAGERLEWRFRTPGEVEYRCGAPEVATTAIIEITEPTPSPATPDES